MDKKENSRNDIVNVEMKPINVEMKPNWIRHVDTRFNVLHILRSKEDLYKLLYDIERQYEDMIVTVPEYIDGYQHDNGEEFGKDHYSRYPQEFSEWHIGHAKNLIDKTGCKSAIDIGCGMGNIVRGFLKNGVDAYGIDISKYAIENCSKEICNKVSWGDIRKIDTLPKIKFDLVTCYNVLEHVSDPDVAIYNLSNLSDKWIHITVRDIRCSYPEDMKIFDPTIITGRSTKWWIDEFEKEEFDLIFDISYTWLIFEPRYALMPIGSPVLQALFRKKEDK